MSNKLIEALNELVGYAYDSGWASGTIEATASGEYEEFHRKSIKERNAVHAEIVHALSVLTPKLVGQIIDLASAAGQAGFANGCLHEMFPRTDREMSNRHGMASARYNELMTEVQRALWRAMMEDDDARNARLVP